MRTIILLTLGVALTLTIGFWHALIAIIALRALTTSDRSGTISSTNGPGSR